MIRYKLTTPSLDVVHIQLDTDHPDGFARIEIDGAENAKRLVEYALSQCHGIDGHLIEEETTPVDLAHALQSRLRSFAPELLEGGEVLARYERKGLP